MTSTIHFYNTRLTTYSLPLVPTNDFRILVTQLCVCTFRYFLLFSADRRQSAARRTRTSSTSRSIWCRTRWRRVATRRRTVRHTAHRLFYPYPYRYRYSMYSSNEYTLKYDNNTKNLFLTILSIWLKCFIIILLILICLTLRSQNPLWKLSSVLFRFSAYILYILLILLRRTIAGGETSAESAAAAPQIASMEALNAAAPEVARQLREWVKSALNEELRRVRLAFDEQLRTADEHLARRLGNAESGVVAPGSRSSRSNSSRAKK